MRFQRAAGDCKRRKVIGSAKGDLAAAAVIDNLAVASNRAGGYGPACHGQRASVKSDAVCCAATQNELRAAACHSDIIRRAAGIDVLHAFKGFAFHRNFFECTARSRGARLNGLCACEDTALRGTLRAA